MGIEIEVAEREDRLLASLLDIIRFTEGVSAKLHRVLDEAEIYRVVGEEFIKSKRYTASIVLLADDGASLRVAEASITPSRLKVLERASGLRVEEFKIDLKRSSIYRQVVREGKTVQASVSDIIREFLPRPLAYLISKTVGYDKKLSILTPLRRQGKVIGAFAMSSTELFQHFIPSVENLALHISTALELAHTHAQGTRAVQALKRYHDHLGELVEERTGELKTVNKKLRKEVSERKQAGEALSKVEQERLAILNSMSEIMIYQDTEHRILWTNKAATESVDLSTEQLVGQHCYEVWPQRSEPCVGCPVAKARETGKPQEAEITTPDGRVWFIRGYPMLDADKNLVGVTEVVLEITERKRAEEALRESEEFRSTLLTNSPHPVVVVNPDASIGYVNSALERLTGFTSAELIGRKPPYPYWTKEALEKTARDLKQSMRKGAVRLEELFQKKNGERFWVEITAKPVVHNGEFKYYLANWVDITGRKQSVKRLQALTDEAPIGICNTDLKGKITYVNKRFEEATGYSREEVVGKNGFKLGIFSDETVKLVAKRMKEKLMGKPPRLLEIQFKCKDGHWAWIEMEGKLAREGGIPVGFQITAGEITERKQAEEALQAEKNKLQSVVSAMEDGLTIQDRDYNIIYQNEPQRVIWGDRLGEKCYRVYEGNEKVCDGCPVEKAFRDGKSHISERRSVMPWGEVTFWENTANPIRDASGRIVSCLEITRNITKRKQAGEALRESQEKLQKMFESVTDGISVIDLNGVIIETNQRMVEMHGFKSRDELLGRNALELVAPRDHERIAANMWKAIKQGTVRGVEYTLLKADGTEFPGELSTSILKDAAGNWVGHITIARDITEREQAGEALRESEERFRSIVENSQAGIMILDGAYRFVYVNDELCRISGYSRDEIIGQDFRQFLDEESKKLVAERYVQRQSGEEAPPRYEFNIVRKDGQKRRVEISSSVIRDSAGEVKTVAQILDVTERKQTEEALRESEEKFSKAFRSSPTDSVTLSRLRDGLFLEVNDSFLRTSGYTREEVLNHTPAEINVWAKAEDRTRMVQILKEEGRVHNEEFTFRMKSGEMRESLFSAELIDVGGEPCIISMTIDISELRKIERALERQEAYFQQLFDNSPDAVAWLDTAGRFVSVNRGFETLLGYRAGEIKGRLIGDTIVPEDRREEASALSRARLSNKVVRKETVRKRKDGSLVDVSMLAYPIRLGNKTVGGYVIYADITERKQVEEALRESEYKYKTLFENTIDGLCVIDAQTMKVLLANETAAKIYGFDSPEEAVGMNIIDFIVPEEGQRAIKVIAKDLFQKDLREMHEWQTLAKDGREIWVSAVGVRIQFQGRLAGLIALQDITERKRAEEKEKQLQQELYLAQRLASVGELAAGVAHEINNPLTGVLGFSQRLMRKSTDEQVRHDLEIIHGEARRAAEVVQNLLTFARRRQPKKEYSNINDIVQRTLELRSYALQTSNIEVGATLAPNLSEIMVDFPQIQEVFLNIILNAEQAMSEAHGRGKLIIKTREIKDYVRISFADDGPGIAPENIDKVFDPFFTTREGRGGTGLGLSACHGIVTEHGGRIYVRSKPEKGTTFFVELPLSPVETTLTH